MAQGLKRFFACLVGTLLLLSALALPCYSASGADIILINDYNSLMSAVSEAKDGDVLLVGDVDFSPLSPDVPNSMMVITIDKSITLKSGKPDGASVFTNGGFVLSGSKLSDKKITVNFENIIFDGEADYEALSEADFEYPWSEAEQVYTYFAPLKAQQALSFKGNVDASFSGCTFKRYMHEYGPVIDIRYGDYTDNEYLSSIFADYSGCRINLSFDTCTIENNTAFYDGGAIYIESNNNVSVKAESSAFCGNRSKAGEFSRGGGVLYASGAELEFDGCTFENNTANHIFSDSTLSDYDTHKGGALLLEACKLKMTNTKLCRNRASMGGALSMTNVKANIDGCRFTDNRAEEFALNTDGMVGPWSNMAQGGAIYAEGNSNDTISLINCEIKDNFAKNAYGGVYGYYSPHEDPSFGTYFIKMALCSYEGNTVGIEYDYSESDISPWASHPGDMFVNPHMTILGCYIVDKTFDSDFPRSEQPSEENGYNFISATDDKSALNIEIPNELLADTIVERYSGRLAKFHVGSNYSLSLYKPQADQPDTAEGNPNIFLCTAITVAAIAVLMIVTAAIVIIIRKRKHPLTQEESIASKEPEQKTAPDISELTNREKELLELLLQGKKRAEIASALFISEETVKKHVSGIYSKLGVSNKSELILKFK